MAWAVLYHWLVSLSKEAVSAELLYQSGSSQENSPMIIPGAQGYERTLLKMLEGLKGQMGKLEAPQRLTAEQQRNPLSALWLQEQRGEVILAEPKSNDCSVGAGTSEKGAGWQMPPKAYVQMEKCAGFGFFLSCFPQCLPLTKSLLEASMPENLEMQTTSEGQLLLYRARQRSTGIDLCSLSRQRTSH